MIIFLCNSSNVNTITNLTKERDDYRKLHASQTNKNDTLSRQLEGSKEKCNLCIKENVRSHEHISGLNKFLVNHNAN